MRSAVRILFISLAALGAAGCYHKPPSEPILVGLAAPLSGPAKAAGERVRQGALLAVEDANQEGKRPGGRAVKLLDVDTRGDPEFGPAQVVRFITVNRVTAFVGGSGIAAAERLGRAAQPYQVPVVTPSGPPPAAVTDNLFPLSVDPAYRGATLARFLAEELRPQGSAVAVADARQESNLALAAAFARDLKERGLPVVRKSFATDAEFPDLVEELVKTQPAAVLFAGVPPGLVKKLRARWEPPALLYGGDEGQAAALLADWEAANGTYLASPYVTDCDTDENRSFVQRFRERYGKEDPDALAALAFEGAGMLFEAMRQPRVVVPGRLREELAKRTDYKGLTGTLTFSKEHGTRRPLFLVRPEQGKLQTVKRYEVGS